MVRIDRLPSGSYRARIHLGGGKYKSITGKDKKDVQLRAAQLEAEIEKQNNIDESNPYDNMLVGDAIDKYIDSKSNILSPSTIRGYRALRRNMLTDLMNLPLHGLTSAIAQAALNNEAANKSPKYIKNARGLLTAALKQYYPNLVLSVSAPQKRKTEIKIPTEDEVGIMIQASRGTEIEIPIILAACCGLRRSEILGLKWSDVDFDKQTISINEAIVLDENNKQCQKGTKTYAGTRVIRAFPFVLDALKRTPRKDEHIVTLAGHQVYNRYKRILSDNGLPDYRLHDLRHYAVSVMLALNIPKKYIADYVGHETENMIDQVYGHIMASKKTSVEDQLQQFYSLHYEKTVTKSVTD